MLSQTISFRGALALVTLGVALTAPAVQAQSGYTVSTLSDGGGQMWLDSSNRAYGNRSRFSLTGYIVAGFGGVGGTGTVPRSAYWAASAAASVSPTNTFALSTYSATVAVSDNGQWQGLVSTYDGGISRAKGTSITAASPKGGGSVQYVPLDINNAGDMAGYVAGLTVGYVPFVWRAGVASQLGCGSCAGNGVALTINNQGVIGGSAAFNETSLNSPNVIVVTKPVRWTNGAVSWTGDQATFGDTAQVVAMNDAGSMVVQSKPPGIRAQSFQVSAAGTVTPLSSGRAYVVAGDINASGVIVGRADGRAVMWVNGAEIDLAAHLASKGVSQANTWSWVSVVDINDQGSMVVEYRESATGVVKRARLTAKP